MGFVGPVNRIGEASSARTTSSSRSIPTEHAARRWSSGSSTSASRCASSSCVTDGEQLLVQLTRDEAETLELERGQIVYVRPLRHTASS